MRFRWARLAMAAVAATMGCSAAAWAAGKASAGGDGPPAVQIGKEKLFPVSVNWVAANLNGKQTWSGADRPSIYIDKQMRMRGYDGCNMFSVTAYPLKGQKIVVGPLAIGRKVCDKQLVDGERTFLNAVRGAKEWDMQGANTLIVKGLGGTVEFERGL